MPLPDDLKRLARDAFNDISATYQAVLTQNTGWVNTSLFQRTDEPQISAELARKDMAQATGRDIEPTRDAPDLTPGHE
jgi:hypothetical protein